MELLDDMKYAKKATKTLGQALRRLRRHNYDKAQGQPGWCIIEARQGPANRVMSAGPDFVGLIDHVGPVKSEAETAMPWGCDFQSTGGGACTATTESRRIAFTFPPHIYPETDKHMMQLLDGLAAELAPSEMDRLVDPQGKMITGGNLRRGRP